MCTATTKDLACHWVVQERTVPEKLQAGSLAQTCSRPLVMPKRPSPTRSCNLPMMSVTLCQALLETLGFRSWLVCKALFTACVLLEGPNECTNSECTTLTISMGVLHQWPSKSVSSHVLQTCVCPQYAPLMFSAVHALHSGIRFLIWLSKCRRQHALEASACMHTLHMSPLSPWLHEVSGHGPVVDSPQRHALVCYIGVCL